MTSTNDELNSICGKRKREEESEEERKEVNEKMLKLQEVSQTRNVIGEVASEEDEKEENHFANLIDDALDIISTKIIVANEVPKKVYENIFKPAFPNYQFSKIDFSNSDYLITFFYRYCKTSMGLARNRFRDAFKTCQQLQDGVKCSHLKIISLGGGPGTDLTGFCSVLQEFGANHLCTLKLTLVDMWKRWESFYHIIRFLLVEGFYGNASTLFKNKNIVSSFITQDIISSERLEQYNKDLRSADIVLLARVVDCYHSDEIKPQDILQVIIPEMKKGAFLFVIDTWVKKYLSEEVTQVYKSELGAYYAPTVQRIRFDLKTSTSSEAQLFVLQKK